MFIGKENIPLAKDKGKKEGAPRALTKLLNKFTFNK